jgi:DNA-binding transcriptional MerR regulator
MSENDIPKAYYTIGEVADMIGESASLLRFWEKEFRQLKPSSSSRGHRRYTLKDVELIKYIHVLTKEKGYTLEGVKSLIKDEKRTEEKSKLIEDLIEIRTFLELLKKSIKK